MPVSEEGTWRTGNARWGTKENSGVCCDTENAEGAKGRVYFQA